MGDCDSSKPFVFVIGSSSILSILAKLPGGISFEPQTDFSEKTDYRGILVYPQTFYFEEEGVGLGVDAILDGIQLTISQVGEIAGQCIYVWVDPLDIDLKEKVVERLRLRERGGVWEFGADSEEDEIHKIEKFFKENLQETQLKPAKRK